MSWIWIRRVALVVSALLAGGALLRPGLLDGAQRETRRVFEETADLRISPELAQRLASEPDPLRQRLLLARRLVTAEVDPERLADLTRGGAPDLSSRARVERLELARRFALDVLRARPAAWDAAMLLGAATYLARSIDRDPRLFTDQRGWEGPLELAWELAPTEPETGRFLVTAYLELWPSLSDAKRRRARDLLAEAFADPATFGRLVGAWLSVAGNRREAFAAIPDEPHAWSTLTDLYARQRDWTAYREARSRWLQTLTVQLGEDLEEAGRRRAGGYPRAARDLYLQILERAVPSARHLPLVRRVLRETPAGPPAPRTVRAARSWLLWALERQVLGKPSFDADLLDRLAGLAGNLEPHQEAHAALAANRLDEAERIERRTALAWHEDWVPYLLARSRDLLERGDAAGARTTLAQAHRSARERPAYWQARRRLAEAEADPGERREAEERLRSLAADAWPATAWRFRSGEATLELLIANAAQGLTLSFAETPPDGAVVEVRLDGDPVAMAEALAGGETVLDVNLSAGLHHLEIRPLAGGGVRPGRVTLRRARSAGG